MAREFLRGSPNNGDGWALFAELLRDRGDLVGAEQAYGKVINLVKAPFEARVELGVLLSRRGATDEAVEQYRQALKLRPQHPLALRNLGALLRTGSRLEEAVGLLEEAVQRAPLDPASHSHLGIALSAQGEHARALSHLRKAVQLASSELVYHDNLLLLLHYADTVSRDELAEAHRNYGRVAAAQVAPLPSVTPAPLLGRRLRVGYVSADFRRHSVAFFLEPLLERRDTASFEVYAYSQVKQLDEVSLRLQGLVDGWRDINGLRDREAAELIRADHIDVLIDLAGHTNGNRLTVFAHKPAPVQLTYLGYPNTTGLSSIDYRITDAEADPENLTEGLHSEALLRLDTGFLCYRPPEPHPEVSAPPSSLGRAPTFGSFNALSKISDATLSMWAKLLRDTPEARLRLKHGFLSQPESRQRFEQKLAEHGLPLERIDLVGHVPELFGHLAAYADVDVALDTYPYHGTTTTCDALYMGVPVVSLQGDTHVARVGASLLRRADLSDLAVTTPEQYVATAQALLRDETRRVKLRSEMRDRLFAGGLTDATRFTRAFESALLHAFKKVSSDAAEPQLSLPDSDAVFRSFGPGLRIATPRGVEQITGYVLDEQGDWFEDEIHFIRKLLKGGETVIDAGANHGVYALSMARCVGPSGRVIAIEPQPVLAERIRASARANEFGNLTVLEAALSEEEGRASFFSGTNTELGSLSGEGSPAGQGFEVRVTTLDRARTELGLERVSFVKLDVEGEEIKALLGARELLTRDLPLLMVERKHGDQENVGLLEQLGALGHGVYRLVPGLGILYPHPLGTDTDPFLLNVFAANEARAYQLEHAGLLARDAATEAELPALPNHEPVLPRHLLSRFPGLAKGLDDSTQGKVAHRTAMAHFALSQDLTLAPRVRVFALRRAVELALSSIDSPSELSRLMTLARVASAWGRRAIALEALSTALSIAKTNQARIEEPFLAACPRFDDLDPGMKLGDWAVSSILEQIEKLRAFSSFFTATTPDALTRLETLGRLGFGSPEMARRLRLLKGKLVSDS